MNKLFLQGLQVKTIIGVLPWERTTPQTVVVDLELAVDMTEAAQQDRLGATIDYQVLATRLSEFIASRQCLLVEALAEQVATFIHEEFQVAWLWLRLSKPGAVANCQNVGVILERSFIPAASN